MIFRRRKKVLFSFIFIYSQYFTNQKYLRFLFYSGYKAVLSGLVEAYNEFGVDERGFKNIRNAFARIIELVINRTGKCEQ